MEQFGAAREVTYLECNGVAVGIAEAQRLRDFLGEGTCDIVNIGGTESARVAEAYA